MSDVEDAMSASTRQGGAATGASASASASASAIQSSVARPVAVASDWPEGVRDRQRGVASPRESTRPSYRSAASPTVPLRDRDDRPRGVPAATAAMASAYRTATPAVEVSDDGDDEYSAVEDFDEARGRGRGRSRRREDDPVVRRTVLEDALRSR